MAIGLSALAGAWWFSISAHPRAMLEAGAPMLFILSLVGQPIPLPKLQLTRLLAFGNLAIFASLALGVGRVDLTNVKDFKISNAPTLQSVLTNDTPSDGHPDVLLISVDTLRADAILNADVPTPNIDKLRAVSHVSDYGVAPSPVTLPSHLSMVTGELPTSHGSYTNLGKLPNHLPTLGEAFKQAGYNTVAVASNRLLNAYTGFDRGFDLLLNIAGGGEHIESHTEVGKSGRRLTWYSAFLPNLMAKKLTMALIVRRYKMKSFSDDVSDSTAEKVDQLSLAYFDELYARQQPFFYFLHYMDPHVPYSASPEFAGQLSASHPLPDRYDNYAQGSLELCKQVLRDQINGIDDSQLAFDNLRARYHEELLKIDNSIGRILERLAKSQRPTVILFTSDHGELFGENDHVLHGGNVYAANIRVPFMLSLPGQDTQHSFSTRPALSDVPLTLLNAAGFAVNEFGVGRNLLDNNLGDDYLVAVSDNRFSVEYAGYKIIFEWTSAEGSESDFVPFALFATASGVAEENNLLGQAAYKQVQDNLTEVATRLQSKSVKRGMREFDDAERSRLNELGYAFDDEGNSIESDH